MKLFRVLHVPEAVFKPLVYTQDLSSILSLDVHVDLIEFYVLSTG